MAIGSAAYGSRPLGGGSPEKTGLTAGQKSYIWLRRRRRNTPRKKR